MGVLTREVRDFVNQTKLGFIATVCPDGTPNLSPKGTTIAWDENHLAFADIHSPGTIGNLIANPGIEINVVDCFSRKGYRFKGTAEVLNKGNIYQSIISHYHKTGIEYAIHNIVWVLVKQVSELLSPAYDNLSEDEIIARWIHYWSLVHPLKKPD